MLRRRCLALLAVLAGVALLPAGASAAVVTVGNGHSPGVAVDAAGTAYVAWYGPESTTTSLQFCRLPRGAAACDVRQAIAAPGTSLSRPFVLVDGATVRVIHPRYGFAGARFDQIWMFTSTDRGRTFDAGVVVGSAPFEEAVLGPGASVTVGTHAVTQGGIVQNLPLDGSDAGATPAPLTTDHPNGGAVGLADPATPVAVFATIEGDGEVRRLAAPGLNINDPASWGAPTPIGYIDYPRLAGGPAGLFLMAGDRENDLVVRRYDGTTFGASSTVIRGDDAQAGFTQDAGGMLHAVISRITTAGWEILHATSTDGRSWNVAPAVTEDPSGGVRALRVASAPDHRGVATWETTTPAGPAIRILDVSPQPVYGSTVVLRTVRGTVTFRPPGSSTFTKLDGSQAVPLGSTIDTRKGTLALSAKPSVRGAVQTANFYDGQFRVAQQAGVTELRLNQVLACSASARSAAGAKARSRRLWGDGKGRFRTRGQYSSATVRGTRWVVTDTCTTTTTRVTRGSVTVRDLALARTIVVRAPRSYVARKR